MFMLKNILGKIWGNPDNLNIAHIPIGQLYLVRPSSPKGYSECIYKDAAASIKRTLTEFHYQLVVQRAYEEGEEQILNEDEHQDGIMCLCIG
ncbi:hypothetical protein PMAC_002632 [Pneumocystis sp. 'macacae']|nr:hypothetical protein PMAC_002632 [Pneumocystis sp. 'macacae']